MFFFEDPDVQKEVLNIIPLKLLEDNATANSKANNTAYQDELVKSLLAWYKKECMLWLNQPTCTNCNEKTQYCDTHPPSSEEGKYAAIRTEIYICNKCSKKYRFPRFHNPAKISKIKYGRCSEYANLFGCILRSLDYDVRFIDNFEDHVWNEYWSEALQKVIKFFLLIFKVDSY